MPEWLSILPPLVAIGVAIWKKEVISALVIGIWLAEILHIVKGPAPAFPPDIAWFWYPVLALKLVGMGFMETITRIVAVFQSPGDTQVLLFGLIVGALLELMRVSGGVSAFVKKLTQIGLTKSPRQVSMLASLTGMAIFVETNMSVLSAGLVSQKLFDKFRLSRARLAFLIDSTCAPISVLILFNAWGAYLLGLLEPYALPNPVMTLAVSVPLNFYPILILIIVWYTAISTKVYGPMRLAEASVEENLDQSKEETPTKVQFMLAPLVALIGGMAFFMWYTGNGQFFEGSGSLSVLMAVSLATVLMIALLLVHKRFAYSEIIGHSYTGAGKLIPVTTIMLLSFAIGATCKALGTGPFVASFVGAFLPPVLVAPLLFICAAIISFTTGTSWGTFAILIPLGIPLGLDLQIPPPFVVSAILGGGVFGDHCSPISDTTVVSSLASGCDHLEHVKTQLPYAMVAGSGAILLYMITFPFIT